VPTVEPHHRTWKLEPWGKFIRHSKPTPDEFLFDPNWPIPRAGESKICLFCPATMSVNKLDTLGGQYRTWMEANRRCLTI
jgi:hypothetical protein